MSHAIYPRLLKVVLDWIKIARVYSVDFVSRGEYQQMWVRVWKAQNLRYVSLCSQRLGKTLPESEIRSLSRLQSCLPSDSQMVSVRGVPRLLQRSVEKYYGEGRRLLDYSEFSSDVFVECIAAAGDFVFGLINPVELVEYLLVRLDV